MTPQEYSAVVKRNSPKSKTYVNCLAAFCIGGGICAVGQGFFEAYNARVFDSPIVKKPLKPHCSSQKFCQEICFMG